MLLIALPPLACRVEYRRGGNVNATNTAHVNSQILSQSLAQSIGLARFLVAVSIQVWPLAPIYYALAGQAAVCFFRSLIKIKAEMNLAPFRRGNLL